MTTLITGGAVFIGSHLVDHLMARGEDVRILDNLSAGSLSNIENWLEDIEFVKEDLLDANHIRSALKDCDTVYHLATNPEVRSWKALRSIFREAHDFSRGGIEA